jgi:two-component system, cell cycle response regulator
MHDSGKERITVVEDDLATRKLLQRQLENSGYAVSAFSDGREALQAICEMGNGIVISDWSMPVMSGLELCQAARELHDMQALGNIHFIMLSAEHSKERIVEGLAAGANDYLTKPYHLGELLARVQVGERMLHLQEELLHRNVEVQKANAQMALLAQRLDHMANTDVLTGLPNRRCLFERLNEAWQTAAEEGSPLNCIMLDIDRFKKVNDTYGHAAGDQVLVGVADVIRRHTRRPELCGRFGGEEFVLVLPAVPVLEVVAIAESFRADLAAQRIECDGVPISTSASLGVAERDPGTICPDDLLCRADAVLYLAKEHGRNQTWVFGGDNRGFPADRVGVPECGVPVSLGERHPGSCIRSKKRTNRVQSAHAAAPDQ